MFEADGPKKDIRGKVTGSWNQKTCQHIGVVMLMQRLLWT